MLDYCSCAQTTSANQSKNASVRAKGSTNNNNSELQTTHYKNNHETTQTQHHQHTPTMQSAASKKRKANGGATISQAERKAQAAKVNQLKAFGEAKVTLEEKGWVKIKNKVFFNARDDAQLPANLIDELALAYVHGDLAAKAANRKAIKTPKVPSNFAVQISGQRTQWPAGLKREDVPSAGPVRGAEGARSSLDVLLTSLQEFARLATGNDQVEVDRPSVASVSSKEPTEQSQPFHADSMLKGNLRALVALTDIDEATHFADYGLLVGDPSIIVELDKTVTTSGQFENPETIAGSLLCYRRIMQMLHHVVQCGR